MLFESADARYSMMDDDTSNLELLITRKLQQKQLMKKWWRWDLAQLTKLNDRWLSDCECKSSGDW
jgi:hypothetical protein